MYMVTIELDVGSKTVFGDLDSLVVRQSRPADIRRKRDGSVAEIKPGRVTTLSIIGVSERKSKVG